MYARSAAADVRLDDDGETQTLGGAYRLTPVADDASFWKGQAELVQKRKLKRLGNFMLKRAFAVDHFLAVALQVEQVCQRVIHRIAMVAAVRRWAHAV